MRLKYILWTRIYVDEEVQGVLRFYFYVKSERKQTTLTKTHNTRIQKYCQERIKFDDSG